MISLHRRRLEDEEVIPHLLNLIARRLLYVANGRFRVNNAIIGHLPLYLKLSRARAVAHVAYKKWGAKREY